MEIPFCKYSGSGNDFVIIDNRDKKITLDASQIKLICDRKQGIGADGVILAEPGTKSPIKMRIYNSDGSEAEMCGNGLRCLSHFLDKHSIKSPTIESLSGLHQHEKQGLGIKTSMTEPSGLKQNIRLTDDISVDYIDTGVPHAVYFVDDVDTIEVVKLGSFIRNHPQFKPRGVN
ncbi:MAG: diaminopimelate epimerase, partial [Parachlamydiaceae bacterium]